MHTPFCLHHVDPPAITLYEKLGTREEALHFDIEVAATSMLPPEMSAD